MEGSDVKHNFESDPHKNHPGQVWFNLVKWFQRRRFKCESLRTTIDNRSQVMAKAHRQLINGMSV
jgi:hypothetical protein